MPTIAEKITIKSQYGVTFDNMLITHTEAATTLIVMIGGAGYTLDAPLFHYIRKSSVQSGCDVLRVEYGYRIAQISYNKIDINKLISDSLSIINLCLEKGYKRVIFVSKSLGTVIAGEVAKIIGYNRITHIFLTPIEGAIPHMMESKGLVIIGAADNLFPTERVQLILSNTNLNIHLIKDGNHGIEVDDFEDSIRMLTDVIRLSIDYIAKCD